LDGGEAKSRACFDERGLAARFLRGGHGHIRELAECQE
jgi:hypothetical protein